MTSSTLFGRGVRHAGTRATFVSASRHAATAAMYLLAAGVLASTPLLNGCKLHALKENVAYIESIGLIGGHASRAPGDDAPIIVVLTSSTSTAVLDSFVLGNPGAYFFPVPAGTYRIAAFVDRNRDFTYQPNDEPAAYYGAPTDVQVASGQKIGNLDIQVGAAPQTRLDFPISVGNLGKRSTRALPSIQVGDIVSLDDPRFSADNGNLGLWQPVEFMFNVGAGVYFLEAYDPKKMPVLFVHGAGGTPDDWRYLVEHLDRKKFQPWLLYYPSGMDLALLGRGVGRWMNLLAARDQFEHIAIVAHSMGGLVSRAAINDMIANGNGGLLSLFVSISTPWNGYGAAAAGVKHSPVVMPMWVDMAPGSPFQEALFRTPLPHDCPYYLFFSYGGGRSLLLDEANDTVVAVSSELALSAQDAATKEYGFNETHVGILSSAEVSRMLNTFLADAVR